MVCASPHDYKCVVQHRTNNVQIYNPQRGNEMIEKTFEEVHSKLWFKTHEINETHELWVVRQVIPWQKIMDKLVKYYDKEAGRLGINLRILVAVLILQKLRSIGDQAVIDLVKENRYAQYFCNVPDEGRSCFLDRSTVVKFRKRITSQGCAMIESLSFEWLRRGGAIENDAALIDSSVLASNVIYPNDVDLLFKAFCKMAAWARMMELPLWWNHRALKKRWRAYNLGQKKKRLAFLLEFQTKFTKAAKTFQRKVHRLADSQEKKEVNTGLRFSNC